MIQMARLTFEDDLETSFILDEESEFLLGRSKECDFQLTDSFVSRLQAKISCVDGRYVIENIGSNPIFINGTRAVKRILDNNDKLTVGKTNLVFRIEEAVASALPTTDEPVPALDQTVFAFDPVEHGPRLVVNTPEGQDRV